MAAADPASHRDRIVSTAQQQAIAEAIERMRKTVLRMREVLAEATGEREATPDPVACDPASSPLDPRPPLR